MKSFVVEGFAKLPNKKVWMTLRVDSNNIKVAQSKATRLVKKDLGLSFEGFEIINTYIDAYF